MVRNTGREKAFTLLEVILAISLTGVVIVLLTTALELLLTRVESSRSRIETSQVARGVLNRIAGDLRAARYYSPSQNTADESSASEEKGSSESDGNEETEDSASLVLGIYGTAKEMRIDRSAAWRWERITRDEENAVDGAASDEMLQTVRYFLNEGDTVPVDDFAAEGIQEEDSLLSYAGLSREQMPTAAWISQLETRETEPTEAITEKAQLLAPEVLDMELAYYDGEELLEAWDSAEQGSLPQAVEITLKLADEPLADKSKRPTDEPEDLPSQLENAIEYRLFVRLPRIEPQETAPGPRRIEVEQESN